MVGLYLPNTVFHPIFFYGALLAGATVTHLSPLDALRELEHKVRDSGAKVVVSVTMPPFAPRIHELLETGALPAAILCDDAVWGGPSGAPSDDPRVTRYEDFIAGADASAPAHEAQPDDVALLQYTGGTTGLPKAAILSHANLTAATQIYEYSWLQDPERQEGEAALVVAPFFHIMGLSSILMRRLKTGGAIVLHQRFDAERVVADIEAQAHRRHGRRAHHVDRHRQHAGHRDAGPLVACATSARAGRPCRWRSRARSRRSPASACAAAGG